jgi:hypothetical protein
VILEDDESDPKPKPKAAAVSVSLDVGADLAFGLTKPARVCSHDAWWDAEDDCFVDADLYPFPPLAHDGLPSASMFAQGLPHSHPQSLPHPLDENGGGGSDENASELERGMELAFEEQEKSSWLLLLAPQVLAVRLLSHRTLKLIRNMIKAGLVIAD